MNPLEELSKLGTMALCLAGFAGLIALLLLIIDRAPKSKKDWGILLALLLGGLAVLTATRVLSPGVADSNLFNGVALLLGIAAILTLGIGAFQLRSSRRTPEGWQLTLFLAPAVLALLVGYIYPALRTLWLSLHGPDGSTWTGVENYAWMFSQPEILKVLANTVIWVAIAPAVSTILGLLYAVLVDRMKHEAIAKSMIFMPMAISFVGASIIWKFVYAYRPASQDQIGLLNQLVVAFGGEPQQWLINSPLNTLLLIVVLVWTQTGFAMVLQSAAIKSVPPEIIEAARIDGASAVRIFRSITVPYIRPTIVVVMVTITIGTLKVFDIVRAMTGGQNDTSVIANEMYNQSFRYSESGQGAALAVFLFVLVLPIVIYQVRAMRSQRSSR